MCNYSKYYADSLDDSKHAPRLSKRARMILHRKAVRTEKYLADRKREAVRPSLEAKNADDNNTPLLSQ